MTNYSLVDSKTQKGKYVEQMNNVKIKQIQNNKNQPEVVLLLMIECSSIICEEEKVRLVKLNNTFCCRFGLARTHLLSMDSNKSVESKLCKTLIAEWKKIDYITL